MEEYPIDSKVFENIKRRQKERQEQFANLKRKHILDDNAKVIVKLPFKELQQKLQNRDLSAKAVLSAFIAKALEVTDEFNCVTEFVPQAEEWASALDAIPNGSKLGALHGIPVAVKDDFDIIGMDSTIGFGKNVYKPATDHAVMVKALLKLGAIPFAKTNVPQSIFSVGSDNPIYGETLNALNKKLAPGGSSSGSGCIVAAGAAPFSLGSDIGGSVRIPSHCHGISTVRPTINRFSDKGLGQCVPEHIQRGVPGVIAPNVETLSFVWKAITENCILNKLDPRALPIPWNEAMFSSKEKLHIGYFTSLPFIPAFEDTQKTVVEAKNSLESLGHKLVEFEMPDDFKMFQASCDLLMAERGMQYLVDMFEGEPVSYCVSGMAKNLRKIAKSQWKNETKHENELSRRENIAYADWGAEVKTSGDYWDLLNLRKRFIVEILKKMEESGVDLLLSPTYPYPAVKVEHGHETIVNVVYTMIWNFVDFPAGVVRFGTESGTNVQNYDDQNDSVLKRAKEMVTESASTGMPITVQIIGTPFKEELVLNALVELENLWKAKLN